MSRLSSITLENFKGYAKSQTIPIKPLTLVFGPNSAGKSSIFHALAFLKWCQSKNNCDPDMVELGWESVRLGGISNLVHDHDLSKSMKIGLGYLRENQWGDEQINTEWKFQSLQSPDSNSQTYTASECNISTNGELIGEFVNRPNDEVTHTPETLDENLSQFENSNSVGINWRGRTRYTDSEIESISHILPKDEEPFSNPFAKLFDRAWDEFIHGVSSFTSSLDNHSKESLSKLREQFIGEFTAHINEEGIRFKGLYPGYTNLFDRDSRNQHLYHEWDYELLNMRNGLASGSLTRGDRWQFFDKVLRRSMCKGKDGRHRGNYLMIPELMGAEMFWIFQDHIHVGPLRQPPFRDLDEATLLERKEWEPWARLIQDDNLRRKVSEALKALGVDYEIIKGMQETRTSFPGSNLQENKSSKAVLRFLAKNGKVATSHLDLGFGVSTILPLVVALHSDCSLLTIEQPELHIHPQLQTGLGDLLIKKALRERPDGGKTTILVESHSEHLLLRIMKRMQQTAEGKLPEGIPPVHPDDLALLFVSPGPEGSLVQEIGLNERGELIKAWPGGFFEEGFNEMFD